MSREPDFRIDRHGTWYYRGSAIRRPAMVNLFAGMLRRRGTGYVLETPEQLLPVGVEDAPFLITDMECSGEGEGARIWLTTSQGERYLLGREHPLCLREDPERAEVRAYLLTRDGIPALVHRNVFYRLAELATNVAAEAEGGTPGVYSDGTFFPLA